MTKEQWDEFEKSLSGRGGSIKMVIDTYQVYFEIQCYKKQGLTYKYCIQTFIKNEETKGVYAFKGVWLDGENEIKRKFFRVIDKPLHTKKDIVFWTKQGRWYKNMKDNEGYFRCKTAAEARFIAYSPQWLSAVTLKNHLLKTCTSIELLQLEEA